MVIAAASGSSDLDALSPELEARDLYLVALSLLSVPTAAALDGMHAKYQLYYEGH